MSRTSDGRNRPPYRRRPQPDERAHPRAAGGAGRRRRRRRSPASARRSSPRSCTAAPNCCCACSRPASTPARSTPQSAAMRDLARYCPPLTTRQLLDAMHHAERVILDEVALDDRLGATSEPWAVVAHAIRRATLEILGAHAEQIAGRDVPISVRDALTTLIASPVFELAVAQEIERALRHQHALALLLFDIDDLSQINREHGWGVGDRLLERTASSRGASSAPTTGWRATATTRSRVLLPETTRRSGGAPGRAVPRNGAASARPAGSQDRHARKIVTVSAAAVGTDLVQSEIDAGVRARRSRSRGAPREAERPQPHRARRAAADVAHDLRRRGDARQIAARGRAARSGAGALNADPPRPPLPHRARSDRGLPTSATLSR